MTALADLTPAEMRQLLAIHQSLFSARSIALARYLAASDAWIRLSERCDQLRDAASVAYEALAARPHSDRTRLAERLARADLQRAQMTASSAWSRSRRLWDEFCALDAAEQDAA